jgi:hypothetical protein
MKRTLVILLALGMPAVSAIADDALQSQMEQLIQKRIQLQEQYKTAVQLLNASNMSYFQTHSPRDEEARHYYTVLVSGLADAINALVETENTVPKHRW